MSNRPGGDGFAMVAARHAMQSSSETGSENYGALPSSYRRRIRKSRSFATVHHSNTFRLRIQRSVPFLRRQGTTTFHKSPDTVWERHNEAVQLAREQYLSESDHQEPQDGEQTRFRRSEVREHHKFRKSVRASFITEIKPLPESKRSSSLTATIRNRVRKVISRTFTKKDNLPPQQLEAQRNYFSDFEQDAAPASGFDAYQVADQEAAHYPPVTDNELLEDLDKFPYTGTSSVSRESLHSNARSRVTSWANSSMTDSIGLRSGAIERNRLSIIKEDGGPTQPSSSAGRHIGGVQRFPVEGPLQPVTNDAVPALDTQRIYSALIKRINDEEAGAESTNPVEEGCDQDLEEKPAELSRARSTIRAVHSESSLDTTVTDRQGRRFSSRSGSSGLDRAVSSTNVDVPHNENADRQRDRLLEQESQSSFFPFSSEKNPNTPSPFKRFLNERRSRTRSRSRSRSRNRDGRDADSESVIVNRKSSRPIMSRPRFGLSTASIYSRTTNGGSNEQYQHADESSEELHATAANTSGCTGTITDPSTISASHDQNQWNPWLQPLDGPRCVSNGSPHTRERPQISSEEDSLNGSETPFGDIPGPQSRVGLMSNNTAQSPRLHFVGTSDQARSRPRETSSADTLNNISNRAEDGSKSSGSLRKLSPGNLAKLFIEKKSQKHSTPQNPGKENSPAGHEGSPPISTPGRLHLQFRNGASTGRLRKRASETVFQARDGGYSTPHNSLSTTPSRSHESPSENAKNHLVARLSRPFNMDVPPHNRPFDSMYLGKRTFGHPDAFGTNSRLSVAPRISEDLNERNIGAEEDQTTALPSRSYSAGRSAAKMFGLLGSKRMVSNFLKSRRADKEMNVGDHTAKEGSPAFL
ncbi:hypothetical protein H2200_003669 [Cladophialophora chaetospira]|uniref:Uncharacterized protein n=1 Tax=Cladophialophora chaetospira TaxID=386627 RepID=A0AA38XEQ1_9EURO|nr:hypothetical protein H2200_003669 [Cladophialophora chaetospira]